MKVLRPCLVGAAVLLLVGYADLPRARGQGKDVPSIEEISSHSEDCWGKATTSPFSVEYLARMVNKGTGEIELSSKTRVLKSGSLYLEVSEPVGQPEGAKGATKSHVRGRNSKYEFRLERRAGADNWVLVGWKFVGEKKANYRELEFQPGYLLSFSHLTVAQRPLFEITKDPGWKTEGISLSPSAPDLWRVRFTYHPKPRTGMDVQYQGWIDLDPAAGWCIKAIEESMTTSFGGKTNHVESRQENVYSVADKRIPVLVKNVSEGGEKDGSGAWKKKMSGTVELSIAYEDSIPEHEFTMSAFGLPEPAGVSWAAPSRTYLWILAGAGVLGALGIAFRSLSRRGNLTRA